MNTYLVPTDFSENAYNAIEYAAEIAQATGRKLLLLHVHKPAVMPYGMGGAFMAEDVDSSVKAATETLETLCTTLREEYPNVACSSQITSGEPVHEIVKVAEQKRAELIIMGTFGANKIGNMLFGSNTALVIEKSSCPVLSVPFSVPFRVPYKMLFATNFSYNDLKGAVQLAAIARAFDASMIIAHIMIDDAARHHEDELIDKFSREVKLLTDYPKISYRLISDNTVSMGLDAVIAETQADMIALSMRKRGIFEQFYNPSITKKFSAHGTIPLLAFHGPSAIEDEHFDFTADSKK